MEIISYTDEYFMKQAIIEAKKAFEKEEVPIGAVIVLEDQIIARGYNYTQRLNDVTAHAEIQAFTAAANYLASKYLLDCTLYVTIEPCIMCAGASYWTQIKRIVYGARDEKRGFLNLDHNILHPKTHIEGGVLKEECSKLMTDFFLKRRE